MTWQNLIDINADGRPDMTYLKDGQLLAWHNIPGFRVPRTEAQWPSGDPCN